MPRKPRQLSSTGIYHVILRSVNQHIIFEEISDYQKFLYILSDCKSYFDVSIYAYCLMDNHIHMLVKSSLSNLSSFFQSLGSKFVRWYNIKYDRHGHLFQDRYHSITIETQSQYLSTLVYIHNNPVKANLCRYPSEYRWSSFNAFLGQKNTLLDLSYSYEIAGSKESLRKYFASNSTSEEIYENSEKNVQFISDEKALEIFKKTTNLPSTSAATNLPKKIRNDYIRLLRSQKLTNKQIARLMDVSSSTIKRICSC